MPLFDNVDNELATVRNYQDKRRAADQVVSNFTEDQVMAATAIHDLYRFLPPGASMGLAAAGFAPDSDVVNRIATSFVKSRSNADLAQVGEPIGAEDVGPALAPDAPQGLLSREVEKRYGVRVDTHARSLGGGGGGGGGIVQGIKHAALEDWSDPMSKLRGLTRAADTYGRFPAQYGQAVVRSTTSDIHDKGLWSTVRDDVTSPNQVAGNLMRNFAQTDVGTQELQLLNGDQIDQGRGFFNNDAKASGQLRRQFEADNSRTITYADGTKHVSTIGRDIAGAFGLEPGTRGYSVVSGFGDAAVQIAAMKVQNAGGAERRAAKAFQGTAGLAEDANTAQRVRDSIGAIRSPGRRLTYDRGIAQAWLDSKEGSTVAEWFSSTASTRDIDRVTGGKLSPAHLRDLADAVSVDDAKKVMQTALDSGEIRKEIGTVAGQVAPWKRMGIEVKDHLPRAANRAIDLVPDTRIDLSDGRKVLDEADKWAGALKLSEGERNALHDTLTRISDEPQFVGDGFDHFRALGARRLAMGERRAALVDTLRSASSRYMDGYSKWQEIIDDPLADVAKKAAATEKVTKAKSFIDDVLGLGSKLEDAEVSYWRDQANTNRSYFGSVVRATDPLTSAQDALRSGASNAPTFDATGKRLFHGTSQRFAGDALVSGQGRSSGNLFGPGLYLTDNPEVAASYMTKGRGKDPIAYAAQWKGSAPAKFFDAEQAAPPTVKAALKGTLDMLDQADYLNIAQDDWDEVQRAFASGSVADFYKSVKTALVGNPRQDVDEILTELNDAFQGAGFDGMTYAGGVRTGNQTHQAHVLFDSAAANLNGQAIAGSFDNVGLHAFGYSHADEVLQPGRASPTLIAEHIGDTMPMPNPKQVREAFNSPLVTAAMKVPGAQLSKHTLEFVMDKVWKPTHLLRPAFPIRVIGDEQARILAEGGDSIFNHPIRALAWSIGDSKFADMLPDAMQHGRSDALGRIFDRADEWAGGLNKADTAFWQDVAYKRTDGYLTVKHGQPGFTDAWHDNLGRLHLDPAGQLLAHSDSLDEAKKVWWNNLRSVREKLAKAHPPSSTNQLARSGADLLTEEGAASYLDDVSERLHHVTQGNPQLLDAIRTGEVTTTDPKVLALVREGGGQTKTINGVETAFVPMYLEKGTPNPVFTEALGAEFDDVGAQGFSSRELVGRRMKVDKAQQHIYDRTVTKAFSWLLGKPDDFLARSPYARQQYWDEVRARVTYLDPDHAPALIANAEAAALPRDQLRTIKRLAGKSVTAGHEDALSLDELHHMGAAHAVDRTQELLYDLSRRHQVADMAKLISPFGEAWSEVIKVWAKQLSQPKVWPAMSVALRGARSEDAGAAFQPGEGSYDPETGQTKQRGLFYKDENGNEMVALPMSRQMMGAMGLPEVPIVGKVKGLSIGTTVMPGLGPVAQIPLAGMMDHFQDPKYDSLREMLFPYGTPRGSLVDQVEGQAIPPAIAKVLNVNGGLDDRQWTSSVADSMRYLASTGKYKVSGEGASQEEINRLLNDAKSASRTMTLVRAAAQSTSPTAPSYEWAIEDKTGKRISMLTLGRELHELQTNPDPQVSDNAIQTFLSRHGEGAFLLLQGKSIAISPAGGLPPTKEAADWLAGHKGAQDSYPYSYGLFAPRDPGNKFDSNTYWQQMDSGEREQLDPEVMLKLANAKVAQARYYAVRNTLGSSINAAQSAALANFRGELEKQYPGYSANGDDVPGAPVKATRTQVIGELESAVKDPKLADSPVTAPLTSYLALRDRVQSAVGAADGRTESSSWATAKKYAPVRAVLFDEGAKLAASSPEFRSVWETVLLPEFDRQLTDDGKVN